MSRLKKRGGKKEIPPPKDTLPFDDIISAILKVPPSKIKKSPKKKKDG